MDELNTYTLTATLGSATNTVTFQDTDDTEATFTAMFKILDSAKKSRLWAKGAIVLSGPDGVINTMDAKANA